jgi:hypothetical protein
MPSYKVAVYTHEFRAELSLGELSANKKLTMLPLTSGLPVILQKVATGFPDLAAEQQQSALCSLGQ